ncbi:hypothetical protein ACFOEZ_01895 [Tianweitania populi]|uniref:Uncharacterized protein n=1 Tax=Tianweitania populi TaxID=1607949 RepID=A0A8J3DM66_9HYPH|nr:hypothetical protein [Tianweitania populi]GHD05648.1 hypothetical protein GCM10016234_01970 [Tianweitania populi]
MAKQKDEAPEATAVQEALDAPGQGDLSKIKTVDLSLHGDGIDHWQDEPQDAGEDAKPRDKDRE